MVYFTGDIHGSGFAVANYCKRNHLTKQDTVVLLGDVGANYFRNERDQYLKALLNKLKPTILCIHGNHEIRPSNIPSYITKKVERRYGLVRGRVSQCPVCQRWRHLFAGGLGLSRHRRRVQRG